jgi:two-component system LytT family response regulator
MRAPRLRVVVVDDEPHARATLRLLLARHPDVDLLAECGDGAEAVEVLRRERPNLVFLDVQMPEKDGFGVLAELDEEETPAVVFVTAYDAHALRAFEVRALDYLLKPFSDERFDRALERVRSELREHGLAELARRVHGLVSRGAELAEAAKPGEGAEGLGAPASPAEGGASRLLIPGTGRTLVVPVADIDWIEAEDYYVRVHTRGRAHLLRRSLADLERELDPARFVRVHRSALVNVDRVRQLRPLTKGDAVLELEGGRELRLSRTHRERLLRVLERR